MKPFDNRTDNRRERAIKKGRAVPKGAVNLAWFDSPEFTPEENIAFFDTSTMVEENLISDYVPREIYYANDLGILEDVYGNQVIEDSRPVVTDEFLVDEDFFTFPAENYTNDDVLPYVHRSRFFHTDHAGLVLHGDMFKYETHKIRVVDEHGNEYVDGDGNRRYKIKIYAALTTDSGDENPYRVYAFVDTDKREDLYLVYDKIEMDRDGIYKRPEPGYREILNPLPFFDYIPEESEVVDYVNRKRKVYSTKPHSLKSQILGATSSGKKGNKVYAPKKAIGDPREYQLFRWRALCKFKRNFRVDPSDPAGIRCGVITTTNSGVGSGAPYALLNLSRSQYNALQLRFYNPLKESDTNVSISDRDRETAEYWEVNLDTVTHEELDQFHLLIWSPPAGGELDMGPYAAKIDHFTRRCGGTLLVDTGGRAALTGVGVKTSTPVNIKSGQPTGNLNGYAMGSASSDDREFMEDHELLQGSGGYGGWNLNPSPEHIVPSSGVDEYLASELNTMSWHVSLNDTDPRVSNRIQYIDTSPSGWEHVVSNELTGDIYKPTMISRLTMSGVTSDGEEVEYKNPRRGDITITTLGVLDTANMLVSHQTKTVIDTNTRERAATPTDYRLYINSQMVEGAYKFLYNTALVALKNKPMDESDEMNYSTVVTATSEWKFSWVIDGEVLSDAERKKNDFTLMPTDDDDPVPVWQRKLSEETVENIIANSITKDMELKMEGAEREYLLEVSNPNVVTPKIIDPKKKPHAWTMEYSPRFEIPVELGPNVVRAAEIPPGYKDAEYAHKTFPAKQFDARVVLSFVDTSESSTTEIVRWSATGTCVESFETGTYKPPVVTTKESEVELTWAEHGANQIGPSPYQWEQGMPRPVGIQTWQNYNYYASKWGTGSRNWASYGIYQQLDYGSRGEVVRWVQDAMNVFQFWGVFKFGTLQTDGIYGVRTKDCVRAFQIAMGARFIDGVVDAETLSIMGSQILRLWPFIKDKRSESGWSRFYHWPQRRIKRQALSDGSTHSVYSKRSWIKRGPAIIWDLFMIRFLQEYNIHGVTLIPYTEGDTPTVMFRSIDIRKSPYNLVNYDSRWGSPIWMNHRVRNNKAKYVPITPRRGDTVIVGVGQDRGTGHGTSRMLGIRDIRAHARVKTSTIKPGVNTIKKQTIDRNVTATGIVVVTSPMSVKVKIPTPKPENKGGIITDVQWDEITISETDGTIIQRTDTNDTFRIINNKTIATAERNTTNGPKIPDAFSGNDADEALWWKSANTGKIGPVPVTGWVSKTDGVMLLCDKDGSPVGFPESTPPPMRGATEDQRHYATLRIESVSNDPAVQVSFYDAAEGEFITNTAGEPEMLYIEYLNRGPSNIYIGVVSTLEVDVQTPIPVDPTAPKVPYNWAMPVYGLQKAVGSRIGLGRLPKGLKPDEPWPIPIRMGEFHRKVKLRPLKQGSISGFEAYQGKALTAFYSVSEEETGGWSRLWGPPYVDIVGEVPSITSMSTIRVSKAPIHAAERPTSEPSPADPIRPSFVIYRQDEKTEEWKKVPWSDIRDYNLSTGEIILRTPIKSSDERLFKVDYTTASKELMYRGTADAPIDINPHSIRSKIIASETSGVDKSKPIYVGLMPTYIKDEEEVVVYTNTGPSILVTNDASVFKPEDPEYNPFVVQLGVIVLSGAADIQDLRIIDTRTRGGGASPSMTVPERAKLLDDSSSYWDMERNKHSYQSSGYVVVRLPSELKSRFSKSEIRDVIRTNITAGVDFHIEDLDGNIWEDED